jgi:Mg-chelatase subunit ChlD
MTNADYTHVTLVVDRSGSMAEVQSDAQGGINTLLTDQFALPGRLTLTLVEFDSEIDTVARMSTDAVAYELEPRGMTRLLDAVGLEIRQTGADLAALDEDDRPARVLFVVVTDGDENSSTEYRFEQVRALVAQQRDRYGWVFQFIGAGDAAWQGAEMGMASARYVASGQGTRNAYATANLAMQDWRSAPAGAVDFSMPTQIPESVDED